jgi:hypothetical protein
MNILNPAIEQDPDAGRGPVTWQNYRDFRNPPGEWRSAGDNISYFDTGDPKTTLIQGYSPDRGNWQATGYANSGWGVAQKVAKAVALQKAHEAAQAKRRGMTKYAFLGDVGGGPASPLEYAYASDPSQLIRRMSRGIGGSGSWVPVAEDSEVAGRLTPEGENRLGLQELSNKDKYGRDGLGTYIKKGYKEPVKVQPQTPAPALVSSPIDSVARNTGLGKASMIPSKAGKYSFARPMGAY